MREERVIALAGALQAAGLVRSLALRGQADASCVRASVASIFKIDADNAADVFGGVANLRLGLETLVSQIEIGQRDTGLTRLVINIMRVERILARRTDVLETLREGIQAIERDILNGAGETSAVDPLARDPLAPVQHAPSASLVERDVSATVPRLAQLYAATLSTLRPRIIVEGNPRFLKEDADVDRVRALLLAAIRAAVLWRQLGGTQLRLFFRHRQYAMMARGLLAQCTLSGS